MKWIWSSSARGERILDRFEILNGPHRTPTSEICLAADHRFKRRVWLQTIRRELAEEEAARTRFFHEALVHLQTPTHPNVLGAYETLVAAGRHLLVLECPDGLPAGAKTSLRGAPLGPVSDDTLVYPYAIQIARGMRHLAMTWPGFVHRNLTPENVRVLSLPWGDTSARLVQVTGFALSWTPDTPRHEEPPLVPSECESKLLEACRTQRTDRWIGTPAYMAPECQSGGSAGAASDIYALGRILLEKIGAPAAHPLRSFLERCLQSTPSRRYLTWTEVERALSNGYRRLSRRHPPAVAAADHHPLTTRGSATKTMRRAVEHHAQQEDWASASAWLDRMAWSWEVEDDEEIQVQVLLGAMHVHGAERRFDQARDALRQALARSEARTSPRRRARVLHNLGITHSRLCDHEAAINCFREAIRLRQLTGDRFRAHVSMWNLAVSKIPGGDTASAIQAAKEILEDLEPEDQHRSMASKARRVISEGRAMLRR